MQIKIFVPTYNNGIVYDIADELTMLFDGCTVYQDCKGFWERYHLDGKTPPTVEIDNITVIEIFTNTKTFHDKQTQFHKILLKMKRQLKQTCVAYSINHKLKEI